MWGVTPRSPAPFRLIWCRTRNPHVDRVDLSYGVSGSDFSATVFYKPFSGDLTGQVIISRLSGAHPVAEERGCRVHGHQVMRVKIGRYRTYYCADDMTFGYLWRWDTASTPSPASTAAASDLHNRSLIAGPRGDGAYFSR